MSDEQAKPESAEPNIGDYYRNIYAKARALFTEEDFKKYEVEEPMVPFEQILADLDEICRNDELKRKSS